MQTENSKATEQVESTVSEERAGNRKSYSPKVAMGGSCGMDSAHVGGTG